ncbi:RteC domain-containing protein [Myroides odoratus]|uniref:RteC domain-containing protein n=1 Tax=Myroides odoratus TaxID=256 RepID=UPI0033402DC4
MKTLNALLTRKEQIIQQFSFVCDMTEQDLALNSYQLEKLLADMQHIAQHTEFRSHKQEVLFYSKHVTETLVHYWFAKELGLLYCSLPLDRTQYAAYLNQQGEQYNLFKKENYSHYGAYCLNTENHDWKAIKKHLKTEESTCDFVFFDSRYDFLFPSYFQALTLFVNHLKLLIQHHTAATNEPPLRWQRSKVDLVLVVYALYNCNKQDDEKASNLFWARAFDQLFKVDISKDFFQILAAFKKRKNIDQTILTEMVDCIQAKYEDIA